MSARSGVDDEPALVRVVAGYVKRAVFDVVTMADEFEAFELARTIQPDVVLLDALTHGIYPTKQFSSHVLVTRIRTLLRPRRAPARPAESARQRRLGDLMIDPEPREV